MTSTSPEIVATDVMSPGPVNSFLEKHGMTNDPDGIAKYSGALALYREAVASPRAEYPIATVADLTVLI